MRQSRNHWETALKAGLRRIGLQARIDRDTGWPKVKLARITAGDEAARTPPLVQDPWEALFRSLEGRATAFSCPVEHCVNVNGLNFSAFGWHPFSEVLLQRMRDPTIEYGGSLLEAYYLGWQPRSAAEALIAFDDAPEILRRLPPHYMYLFPWGNKTLDELDQAVRAWYRDDCLEHGQEPEDIVNAGFKEHGPVNRATGQLELKRLNAVVDSISQNGYSREFGDIGVAMIRRGDELRFLNFGGGLHRTAALRSLGEQEFPARLTGPKIIDSSQARFWPQVRRGIWTETQALRYVDHLFDFDAREWAKKIGLIAK